ncbi:t-SNARE [Cokeromyces recurvatus]|uniref:t-SNARE n=1 Tax=Cokeromyces recurvatus TaxID=90255 RepID=UPI00222128A0|nr:t-SNARE [Cokeromyces recurvatus]KAI7903376.1 t-SNARE [Cokeromyces recurvatus]
MSSRFTMSRDRLAELRGGNSNEKRYDRLSDEDESVPPMPTNRYDTNTPHYRPPVPPTSTYQVNSRGDRHATIESKSKETYEMSERVKTHGVISTDKFFQEVEEVKELNKEIIDNITLIEEFHCIALSNINDEQTKENNYRLEKVVKQTARLNKECKDKIKAIEASNARMPINTGDLAMRKTQHAALKKKFIETIQRYQDIERTYQQKYRQRVERQIKIVQPNATQDDIDRVLQSDEPQPIFAQSLVQSNRSGQAKAVLSEVQSRHDDIKRIEKTILELHQLFIDMQMMVEQQSETIQQIEQHAESTVIDLEQGAKDIDKAILSAKKTRAKKWICFVIFIIILIVIGILIWWFGFDHAGIN